MGERGLYRTRIRRTCLGYSRARYPDVDAGYLHDYAEIARAHLRDEAHWLTQRQVNRFYEHAVALTANLQLARDAGRFSASTAELGLARAIVLGAMDSATVFALVGRIAQTFTRGADFSSRKIAAHEVEVVVTAREGVKPIADSGGRTTCRPMGPALHVTRRSACCSADRPIGARSAR